VSVLCAALSVCARALLIPVSDKDAYVNAVQHTHRHETGWLMKRCCIESLALKGIADGFVLTPEGGDYTCDQCGRYYQIANGHWTPAFKCSRCGAVSYNINDIRERYCGRCHVFIDD
jgi:hypothetical protein